MEIAVILIVLAVVAVAMVVWSRQRGLTDLSSQETRTPDAPVRDRPAGPAAESMDPEEYGDHSSSS